MNPSFIHLCLCTKGKNTGRFFWNFSPNVLYLVVGCVCSLSSFHVWSLPRLDTTDGCDIAVCAWYLFVCLCVFVYFLVPPHPCTIRTGVYEELTSVGGCIAHLVRSSPLHCQTKHTKKKNDGREKNGFLLVHLSNQTLYCIPTIPLKKSV